MTYAFVGAFGEFGGYLVLNTSSATAVFIYCLLCFLSYCIARLCALCFCYASPSRSVVVPALSLHCAASVIVVISLFLCVMLSAVVIMDTNVMKKCIFSIIFFFPNGVLLFTWGFSALP